MNKNVKITALVLVIVLAFTGGFCIGNNKGFNLNYNYNSADDSQKDNSPSPVVVNPTPNTPSQNDPAPAQPDNTPSQSQQDNTPSQSAPDNTPSQSTPDKKPSNDKPQAPSNSGNKQPQTPAKPDKTSSKMPTAKNDIINFYKKAVNDVQANGKAGYTKKEWQSIGNLNITGNGVIDGTIEKTVGNYATSEDKAEDQVCPKGDQMAKDRFPWFTLKDYSKIKSAKCTAASNGNYNITIVTAEEDTPKKGKSFLGEATNSILYWEDIEAELQNLSSVVKGYDDVHVLYKACTIEAEMTPDGKFVSLKHTANVDITIGMAKILFITLNNKSAHMDNFCTYTDFVY